MACRQLPPGGLLRTHLLDIVPEPKVLTTSTSLQSKPKVRPGGGGIVCKYVGTICKLCWALLNVTYKHIVTFLNVMLAVRACFDPTFVFKKIKIQIVYCHLYHKHKQCFIYLRQNVLMNYSRLMNNRNFKNVLILTKLIIMIRENTLSFTQSGNKII